MHKGDDKKQRQEIGVNVGDHGFKSEVILVEIA